MRFGTPIWLLAAAGIIIPVLIHWWRSRSGRVLEIPSIRFLEKDAKAVARKRQLQDLLLLLTRCLLFIIAALWLAVPFLHRKKTAGKTVSGWLLISDDVRPAALTTYNSLIDSLRQTGYELRAFRKGFPPLEKKPADTGTTIPYFSLLDAADRQLRDDQSLFLITGNDRTRFGSSKPGIAHAITWRLLPVKTPAVADTIHPISIAIQAGAAVKDAGYLSAAFRALQQAAMPGVTINDYKPGQTTDWLFWLDTKQEPAAGAAKNIVQYTEGKRVEQNSWLQAKTGGVADRPALYRQAIPEEKKPGRAWWIDAAGTPVLWSAPANDHLLYFSSRFHPGWNNLVWSPGFPEWLAGLLLADQEAAVADNPVEENELHDFRSVAQKAGMSAENRPIPDLFWLALLLFVFAVERILTYRKNAGA
ncbi:MAG: BatA domain-containing protein [Flavihumibacter sp.]